MSAPRPTSICPSRRGRRAGFALLITITLLAFLVILLVGLATYTRVETAVAGNTQRQAQARQNALLALKVAVAQLQKYAGPDTRVTATAESVSGVNAQKRRYTGVWDTAVSGAAPVWLASGLESGTSPTVTSAIPAANQVAMVGTNTDGSTAANNVVVALQNISVPGVPGQTGSVTIGKYAWWVGDQGVKAPVGSNDPTSLSSAATTFGYAPFDAPEVRSRITQQVSVGSGAADTAGAPVFEPRDTSGSPANASLATNLTAYAQLGYFRRTTSTVGLALLKANFHVWSPDNLNVLASTAPASAGLRRDLSINPALLGAGFAKWADYSSYMESPADAANGSFPPQPPLSADPLRRRYLLQPVTSADGAVHSVAPVLSYFLLTFNIRTVNQSTAVSPLEARARWMLTLWNPYTSALVPENLRLEVTGLPNVRVDDETSGARLPTFSLQDTFGSPLKISLPWDLVPPNGTSGEDRRSWLPGRTYTWASGAAPSASLPDNPGYGSNFYTRSLDTSAGQGVVRPVPITNTIDGDNICHIDGDSRTISVKLFAVRATGDVELGTFTSPVFESFATNPQKISQNGYQFSYLFRLAESSENPAWLQLAATDPHQGSVSADAYVGGPNGLNPALYENYKTISAPDRLLDRASDSQTYNEDVPVFELPRGPILSLGALQHLAVVGSPPFAVASPAAAGAQLAGQPITELFDRYFFSGLAGGVQPTAMGNALVLPNPTLKPLPRLASGQPVSVAVLRSAPNAQSSKYLLQASAFNINSTSSAAWTAVLRGVRFPAPGGFRYLDADSATGTAGDDSIGSVQSTDAQFFRFSQSAQEVYKAEADRGAGAETSAARTEIFRRGMRTLSSTQVATLATRVADAVRRRITSQGPFYTMQEFLSLGGDPADLSQSLLEKAIADAALNADVPEFSSQWLTQADIMTALAPLLFVRSDTFVVRVHGEAVNPVTSAVEGRAWGEAILQRTPEYFDPIDPAETAADDLVSALNQANGRRFKVISFRWLTRSDI